MPLSSTAEHLWFYIYLFPYLYLYLHLHLYPYIYFYAVAQLVEALRYKPDGLVFDSL